MADRITHRASTTSDPEGDCARIHDALVRLESALASRPGFGHASQSCTTTLVEGLRCRSEECGGALETDLPACLGGTGTAPTPSMLVRAALGSCLAMGYRLRAARRGLDVRSIRVVVETDSAIAGMLDTDEGEPAGFTNLRYHVEITSDMPPERVLAIVDEADRLSPILDVVSRLSRPVRSVSIIEGAG